LFSIFEKLFMYKLNTLGQKYKLSAVKQTPLDNQLQGKCTSTSGVQAIPQRLDPGTAALSFMQQRLWFLEQLDPGNFIYNTYEVIHLTGLVEINLLEQSLNESVRRHEVLRTTFVAVDGQPIQVITPNLILAIQVINLQNLLEMEGQAEALRLARAEIQQPFNLSQGPLLRVKLIKLAQTEHVLVLTMHQIISDNWSMGIFVQELASLYTAFSNGELSPLNDLPIQYADFAVWQRQWLQGEVLETQLSYWKRQLVDAPVMLELPTDQLRPPIQTLHGARQSLVLSQPLSKALEELSQQENVTLSVTLLAAFKTLLYRYTGQVDILVGSPVDNRNRAEVEGLMGLFVNTLVLRTNLTGNPTFREVLQQVKQVTLDAYAHQDLPFEKLVEELAPERHLSHTPLFQVMFLLQEPRKAVPFSDLQPTLWEVENGGARFDLTLAIKAGGSSLSGTIEYNSDLFETATITRMLGHWQTLLEAIVATPDQRITLLPLLTLAERQQILSAWNSTQRESTPLRKCYLTTSNLPSKQSLVNLFEAQVAKQPEATAFICNGEELSYQELNRRANQIADYLQSLGAGPEVIVGICLERSLDLTVSLLGVLKAGGVYLPLDPSYPQERLAFMFENANAAVLVTRARYRGIFQDPDVKIVCLDTDKEAIAQQRSVNPINSVTPEHLAYIIYTSGSTGKPKGVTVEPRQLLNRFIWVWKEYPFETGEVCCQNTALNFVDSLWELLGPLLQGVPIIIIPQLVLQDPQALVQVLATQSVTRIWVVPSLLRLLLDTYPDLQQRLPALRFWAVGGEALSLELLQRFQRLMQESVLYNLYGTSEVWDATCYTFNDATAMWHVPIGRPISNVQVYVLSPDLQPLPVGIPGDLYIAGSGLARCYLNQPVLTAEKFIPNPYSNEPGGRLYKTGDLVRYLPDGNVEFLGRSDYQVKIRGFRIELGEIEAALSQHPGVRTTVVLAREDVPGDKHLVAYVVPHQFQVLTLQEMRKFLRDLLPNYMVPSTFVMLEALPLTPNGKVDRRALKAPEQARPELETAYLAPRDSIEFQLTKIWEELLEIQPIGVKDNFFDSLGGHSMLAVRLLRHIEKSFGKELTVATLFEAPTVEQLAHVLSQEGKLTPWSSLVAIQTGGAKPPFFAIHGAYGGVVIYYNLARHLGPEQPFYGLQPLGLDEKQAPQNRIEDMASEYIRKIRTVQPKGPYFLGGFSLGGKVAFEMAQQLHLSGQKVAMLAMFDTQGSEWLQPLSVRTRLSRHLTNLSRLKPKEKLAYLHKKFIRRFDSNNTQPLAQVQYQSLLQEAHEQADRDYIAQVYPGRAILFRAMEQPEEWLKWLEGWEIDPELGWGKLVAGGLEIHDVHGNHNNMFYGSYLPVLAGKLKACLDLVQTDN